MKDEAAHTAGGGRLFFAGIILMIGAFAGIGFFASTRADSQIERLTRETNSALSDQVAEAMGLWLNEQRLQAVTLASDRLVTACAKYPNNVALREELEKKFRRQHSLKPYLTMINLMLYRSPDDPPVRVLLQGELKTVGNGQSLVDSISGRSVGIGDTEHFSYIRAVAEGSATFISEAKPNAVPGLPPVFMIAVPVRDEGGKLLGALGYGVKIDYFTNLFIAEFSMGATGRMEILDDRGLYMGSAAPAKLLNDEYRSQGQELLSHLDARKATAFRLVLGGKEYDYAASPVKADVDMANRWWVLSHRSVEDLRRESSNYGRLLLLFCAVGAALSAGLILLAFRSVVQRRRVALERHKRTYVDDAPYGLLRLDADGRVLEANAAACALFGRSPEELHGISQEELLPGGAPPSEDPPAEKEAVMGLRGNGEELQLIRDARRLDDGGMLFFLRDDTTAAGHRKAVARLSENLAASLKKSEELRRRVEHADKAKSAFLADMSHEIRTPLNAVVGLTHLLELTRLDERQEDYVRKITAASRRLTRVIADILDFSGLEAGKVVVERVPFHLRPLLAETRAAFLSEAEEKGLHLDVRIEADVPVYLEGDPAHLRRVLGNVLGNAVDCTARGGVTLSCRRLGPAKNNGVQLEFRVRDTGAGLDEEQRNTLFRPFVRTDSPTCGGTVLWPIVCRRLLALMGGEMSVESAPGSGTTVILSCPFGVTDAASVRDAPEDAAKVGESLRNRIFLLADDDPINRQIMVELLGNVGAEVITAADGHEALACLGETPTRFDAVLMDLRMPGMDGCAAAEAIRAQARFKNLPIVAMTAHAMSEERERCLAAGMTAHIAKPVEVEALYAVLARVLR